MDQVVGAVAGFMEQSLAESGVAKNMKFVSICHDTNDKLFGNGQGLKHIEVVKR